MNLLSRHFDRREFIDPARARARARNITPLFNSDSELAMLCVCVCEHPDGDSCQSE